MAFDNMVLGALVVTSLLWPSDFDRHRGRYDAVIDRAAALAITPGSIARFRGDWAFDPTAGSSDPNVCALRTGEDGLAVAIIAVDWHHGGRSGYLYAKPELPAADLPGLLDRIGCGEWETVQPIEAGWWALASQLD